MRGRGAREALLEREPDGHGIDADRLPRQARHEQLGPVRLLDEGTKSVRDLEPTLIIDFGGVVAPEHVCLLHFAPQKSTAMVRGRSGSVNGKMQSLLELR
jgi:hypothetical protein